MSRTHVVLNIETCETAVTCEEGGLYTVCVLIVMLDHGWTLNMNMCWLCVCVCLLW